MGFIQVVTLFYKLRSRPSGTNKHAEGGRKDEPSAHFPAAAQVTLGLHSYIVYFAEQQRALAAGGGGGQPPDTVFWVRNIAFIIKTCKISKFRLHH